MMRASSLLQRSPLLFLAAVLVALAVFLVHDTPSASAQQQRHPPRDLTVTTSDSRLRISCPTPDTCETVSPGTSRLNVSWKAPASGTVTGYRLHYTYNTSVDRNAPTTYLGSKRGWIDASHLVSGTETSVSRGGFVNGRTYRVRVRAVYAGGTSHWVHGSATTVDPPHIPDDLPRPANVTLSLSQTSVSEGSTVTLTATLDEGALPLGASASFMVNNASETWFPSAHTLSPPGPGQNTTADISIPEGQTTATATVTFPQDGWDTGDVEFKVSAQVNFAHPEGQTLYATDATVTLVDDDTAGVTVTVPNPLNVPEFGTTTYTMVLDASPVASVTVRPTYSSDAIVVTPVFYTFGIHNWDKPFAFEVHGRNDPHATGDKSFTINHVVSEINPQPGGGPYASVGIDTLSGKWKRGATSTSGPQSGSQNAPCDNCGTGGDTGVVAQGQGKYADLIAQMKEWRNDPEWSHEKAHTDRWDRALLAFGETVDDATLTPMTAAEAQGFADRGWERWVEVAEALWELQNQSPTVSGAIADVTIVNESGSHEVSLAGVFDDADGDSLTISAASSDEATATASVASDGSSLTVTARLRGTATITVTADDGKGGTAEDSFTVTVKAAPLVAQSLADVDGLEMQRTRDVSLIGVFSDADGDALTITATSSDEAIATAAVAPDGSDLTLTGVAEGTATVTVTAQDSDGNSVSDAFQVEVVQRFGSLIPQMYQWRNDPQWSSHKAHTDRWDRALLALGETVADTTLTPMTAAEAQALADQSWGVRWVPVAAALWQIEGGGQQETPNADPTVSSAISDATIVNQSGSQQVSLSGVFDDADGDSLIITAASSDEAVATVSVASDGSSLTVAAQGRGTATITVTASDGNGGTISDSFTVTVKAAPTVSAAIADVSGLEAGSTQEVSLSGVFSDADGDSLTISATSGDDAKATVSVASDGSKLTLTGVAQGTATITVNAQDSDGNRVSDAFQVEVVAPPPPATPNQAPTVSSAIADATIVNESGTKGVSLSGVFDDADGDALTITAASSDEAKATVSVASDGSSLTVAAKSRGTATITVTASDGNGDSVEDSFTVTVKAAPVVASAIADIAGMTVGDSQDIDLSEVFSDADGDALSFSAETSDFEVVEAFLFLGTLTVAGLADGTATITVTAEDADGNTVSDAFDVEVVGPPSPVSGLSCVATTDRVLFTWDVPEWSGAQVYAYDYDLTRPDGGREQSRLQGYPAVSARGDWQAGQQASISVKAVYELADGSEVYSEAATLSCTVAE